MKILGLNGGHDGALAVVEEGSLVHAREAEKGSHARHSPLGAEALMGGLLAMDDVPDVVAHSGWWKGRMGGASFPTGAGYHGVAAPRVQSARLLGRDATLVFTSHERSHLFCSLGLSAIPPDRDCQVLLWEGDVGRFYRVSAAGEVTPVGGAVLAEPGSRYIFAYALADPSVDADADPSLLLENAGKMMALAAYCEDPGRPSPAEAALLEVVLGAPSAYRLRKRALASHPLCDAGVESDAMKRFARLLTDAIFDRFWAFAGQRLDLDAPLVMAGGCALNCEWNTRFRRAWRAEVFVPPCPNDSGVAIGAAIDAQQLLGGPARVSWRVDAGEAFAADRAPGPAWRRVSASATCVARLLEAGCVLAWVSGRFELGPRALGHRSILAAPFEGEMHARLNRIKQREGFRPIAPVCQVERVHEHFDWQGPSPHMLYFQKVTDARLAAVTHVDGTARVQTVDRGDQPALWELLEAFRQRTGVPVLCNTSLNYKGLGFINAMSELETYAEQHGLDGFVVDGEAWIRRELGGETGVEPDRSFEEEMAP
ncbi:MAG TPA: carbamoyltransferase C-terminal domain-containing protein [Kofleriaceae bacterium]|nr:carbamoyltransferase C-terminal domain-containing protein [Kofleriaceae bacterium]